MEKKEFGKKLIAHRELKGLTQKEVAEKSGVTERTIQRIEAGNVIPRSYTIKLITDALSFSFFEEHLSIDNEAKEIQTESKNELVNNHYNNKIYMKKRVTRIAIPIGVLAISLCIAVFMGSEKSNNSSQNKNQPEYSSEPQDRIEVAFTNSLTEDSLSIIQSDLSSLGISLDYKNLDFDEKGQLEGLACEVNCNDGFQGSFATKDLSSSTKSGKFGFYRDYSESAMNKFGTGAL